MRLPIIKNFTEHLVTYPTPININYLWGFGSLSGIFLLLQIVTGIILSFHYTPEINLAFYSVEHIMRDVNYGWFFRYSHSNGASFFFLAIYVHIARGLYFQSYKNSHLWASGILILILAIVTAFLGYVLPWGQMSFWAATVITNLVTAVPLVGNNIAIWLWGGFSINNATLNRFFSLHYLLPFILAILSILHIILLHIQGSTSPLQLRYSIDFLNFYPYYVWKDLFGLNMFLILFIFFVCFYPNYLGHSDNYIKANPLITPTHIVPEWYFLPFYAILRTVPNKFLGVIFMLTSILILLVCPFHVVKMSRFNFLFKLGFWIFLCNFILLGFLGAKTIDSPYTVLSIIATFLHFYYFLIFLPQLVEMEKAYLTGKKFLSNN